MAKIVGFRYCTLVLEPGGPLSGFANSTTQHGQGFLGSITSGLGNAKNWSIAIHGLPPAQADYVVGKIKGAIKDAGSSVFIVLEGVFTNPFSMVTYCMNIMGEMKYRVTASNSTQRYETVWTFQLDE